jgi:hypothetical protein
MRYLLALCVLAASAQAEWCWLHPETGEFQHAASKGDATAVWTNGILRADVVYGITNGVVVAKGSVVPLSERFINGIEAPRIWLNPYFDGHGYEVRRDDDGVLIAAESHSTPKTDAEIDANAKAISDQRKAARQQIITLIENRMDTINTNGVVTTAAGKFTVFSSTMEQVKGGIATVKGTARWRGVTVDATASNSCTFQVWTAQNAKAGAETNNWTITLWK